MWILTPSRAALVAAFALVALGPAAARADESTRSPVEDPALELSRARFRVGMASYQAGDFANAIVVWEAIYRELGPERGYRLAFNLGRAYDAYGDPTRAAEHYERYLDEVTRRRAGAEPLDPQVQKQAVDASARISELVASKGRIRVPRSATPLSAQIDGGEPRLAGFVAYVAPGKHTVVLGTGVAAERRDVEVREGAEIVVVARPPAPLPRPPDRRLETRVVRPFSPAVLYVGAALAAAAVVAPVIGYTRALSIASAHDSSSDPLDRERLAGEYPAARSAAYATLAVPVALATATVGLTVAFFLGSKSETVRVGVGASPGGLAATGTLRF